MHSMKRRKPSRRRKKIVIIAGPNGAGETTFAEEFLPHEAGCPDFINADLIARGLSPFAPEKAALQAGKIMLTQIAERARRKESFAFETTLSGLNYAKKIPQWRRAGYHVKLLFLSLPSADIAVARVAARVRQGGHNVPEAVIRRRFDAGMRNFEAVYRGLVNSWVVYDSSDTPPRVIQAGENP
jgi:predicted ABC-type ATPase